LEPFITPAYYQTYDGAVDEWTLSTLMAADTANGGISQLEDHYRTFVTERDIAEMAGAGLNWIRLPIPFWAIETWPGEPFLARTSWTYILKVLGWARKYGIRVNLDLHTIPGSQNGYNHSGRVGGTINFLFGIMGIANAQRTLGYIRIFTEFISQPEWQPVVQMFGVVNEPIPGVIGQDILSHFYLQTHNMMRSITGVGAGNGPFMSMHDGFIGLDRWTNFLPGSDRIALDSHPYIAFNQRPNTQPIATGLGPNAGGTWPAQACEWGPGMNLSQTNFGFTYAGEFSNAFNDCGTFVHGVGAYSTPPTYGGDCSDWTDSSGWNATTKAGIQAFAMASMDALQNWFFWTWKIGNATSGHVEAPLWSYQLGLENGWMPTDPRQAVGACAQAGVTATQFDGTYLPWQTGGAGAGTISANATALYGAWPPASLNGLPAATDVPLLPSYTSTGPVVTLPPPTFTASATVAPGNGWYDAADNGGGVTTISGCTYPDPWMATGIPIPAACAAANPAATAAR
jgi:aryl-phospho-beta-D-glucosidase BglC (GH1 family)